MNTSSR